jgi:hypothetical protein
MAAAEPAGTLAAHANRQPERRILVRSPTYEITFTGQAGAVTRAEFDDCQVTVSPDTTTLSCELPDQAALGGLIERIIGLRLEITRVLLVGTATQITRLRGPLGPADGAGRSGESGLYNMSRSRSGQS